jgi:hypothetical protein
MPQAKCGGSSSFNKLVCSNAVSIQGFWGKKKMIIVQGWHRSATQAQSAAAPRFKSSCQSVATSRQVLFQQDCSTHLAATTFFHYSDGDRLWVLWGQQGRYVQVRHLEHSCTATALSISRLR